MKRKKIHNTAIKAMIVEIDGEKVEVPFDYCNLIVLADEGDEFYPSSKYVGYQFSHKGRPYEAVLEDI